MSSYSLPVVRDWTDLFLTSEGVIRLTFLGFGLFFFFVLFGPAPVDEKQLDLDRQWARHHKRGSIFHQKQKTDSLN